MDPTKFHDKLVANSKYKTFDEFVVANKEKEDEKKLPYKFIIREPFSNDVCNSCHFMVDLKTKQIYAVLGFNVIKNYYFDVKTLDEFGKYDSKGKLVNFEDIKEKNINEQVKNDPSSFAKMIIMEAMSRGQQFSDALVDWYPRSYTKIEILEKLDIAEDKISFEDFIKGTIFGKNWRQWNNVRNGFLGRRVYNFGF